MFSITGLSAAKVGRSFVEKAMPTTTRVAIASLACRVCTDEPIRFLATKASPVYFETILKALDPSNQNEPAIFTAEIFVKDLLGSMGYKQAFLEPYGAVLTRRFGEACIALAHRTVCGGPKAMNARLALLRHGRALLYVSEKADLVARFNDVRVGDIRRIKDFCLTAVGEKVIYDEEGKKAREALRQLGLVLDKIADSKEMRQNIK